MPPRSCSERTLRVPPGCVQDAFQAQYSNFAYEIKGTLLGVCVRTQIIFWIAETFRPIAVFPDVQKFLTTFIASVERNV